MLPPLLVSSTPIKNSNQETNEKSHSPLPPLPVSSTPIKKSNKETNEKSHSPHDKQPVIIQEIISPKLPPIQQTTHNPIKDFSQKLSDHSQSNTNDQQKRVEFSLFYPKLIAHSTSEQVLSTIQHKQQPMDPRFARPGSLAFSYVFTQRIIDVELARTLSFDSEQKTVWD